MHLSEDAASPVRIAETNPGSSKLYEIDPLSDQRWAQLVERASDSSVFHSIEWLTALRRTYGFEPVAFSDSASGEALRTGVVFCRVRSVLTGRRLVSLPFSDHCDPLGESAAALAPVLELLKVLVGSEGRYVELRPRHGKLAVGGFGVSNHFCFHAIDLRPEIDEIFQRLHKNHIQRAVRKAERLGVSYEVGRSPALLAEFFALHQLTRQRQGTPIQPVVWFRNLMECFGDRASIYVARYEGRAVASILTLLHKSSLVYKYGCSDASLNRVSGTPFLFWKVIQDAKARGLSELDLGRSDVVNPGLVAFKDHLGGTKTTLDYYRYPGPPLGDAHESRARAMAKRLYMKVPSPLRRHVDGTLYRHFA